MPDYITTYKGTHFYPLKPRKEDIHIEDIAHALSLICRGNGHVKHFFSVGQHCVSCAKEAEARNYTPRVCLACLLHDAGEAYLSDVPRPFKQSQPAYQELEEHLLSLIYEKYLHTPLTVEEEKLVKQIDDDLLYFDLQNLLGEVPDGKEPVIYSAFSQELLPFEIVEKRYLELFGHYRSMLGVDNEN